MGFGRFTGVGHFNFLGGRFQIRPRLEPFLIHRLVEIPSNIVGLSQKEGVEAFSQPLLLRSDCPGLSRHSAMLIGNAGGFALTWMMVRLQGVI